ncbi:ROK family transcriptional regulator [Laceyella putida]|uniref:ROK family transcriptional regulator n=1 Tax=Laceyella putida TaxID=110101 RepID=A0ABW2RNN5_9BACL
MQTGSFQWMKSLNKSTILNMVRLHGPISRAEIAKLTKLTPPTVTNIVSELLQDGLIVESNLGESTGGRKPIMLRINASRFYVIGIYAREGRLDAAVAHLDGKMIHQCARELPTKVDQTDFLESLKALANEALALAQADGQPVLGIGVGMHGLVNPLQGESVFAPHLHLKHVPIKAVLEEACQLPVEVENDVRAMALAESWFGQGREHANFITVHIGSGIGAGIVLDNELYHGVSFAAGEIGHTTIDVNGPLCRCGNVGCLEALAAEPALVTRARAAIEAGRASLLSEMVQGELTRLTEEHLYMAINQGDELAKEIFADAGQSLGIGLANLINTFNPLRIIINGSLTRAGAYLIEPLLDTVQKRTLDASADHLSIVVSDLGKQAALIGAYTLALRKIFAPSA